MDFDRKRAAKGKSFRVDIPHWLVRSPVAVQVWHLSVFSMSLKILWLSFLKRPPFIYLNLM